MENFPTTWKREEHLIRGILSSAFKAKAITQGHLAPWVIKAFHSAIPYSNEEEEISLFTEIFLGRVLFLLIAPTLENVSLLVSSNIFLNCESVSGAVGGGSIKILHRFKL